MWRIRKIPATETERRDRAKWKIERKTTFVGGRESRTTSTGWEVRGETESRMCVGEKAEGKLAVRRETDGRTNGKIQIMGEKPNKNYSVFR